MPPSLWTTPLNDYHPWHNATLAFMFGPLVLAGVNISSDLFIPDGDRMNPASFISRTKESLDGGSLAFEATGTLNGTKAKIQMLPLQLITSQKYVVYFMTAGTKPPQPTVHYCPHSARDSQAGEGHASDHDHDHDHEGEVISAGPPPPAPTPSDAALITSRGVEWRVDAQSGRVWAA